MYEAGELTVAQIAAEFGVTRPVFTVVHRPHHRQGTARDFVGHLAERSRQGFHEAGHRHVELSAAARGAHHAGREVAQPVIADSSTLSAVTCAATRVEHPLRQG